MLEIVRSLLSFILREVGFIMVLCERQHAMNIKVCLVVLLLFHAKVLSSSGISTDGSSIPGTLNIGALMSFNSSVGKVAKLAIETAVNDVNSDQTVLASTNLQLTFQDTDYGGYLGMVETLSLTGKETVAIVGPQFSVTAHVISHIVNELQVPMLSFAATDPTLSSLQYPFFVRTTQSDVFQMAAIADIVDFYGWRDVIAIYVDDDHGRNGIAALGDILAQRRCKISHRAPLSPEPSQNDITNVLVNVAVVESRILVLLTYPNWGLEVFRVANYLGMTGTGYVWIVTDWLSTVLDSQSPLPSEAMDDIQGVLTFRMYTPDSQRKKEFASRWTNLTAGSPEEDKSFLGLTTYGLYAYDTVWLLAYAIDEFLNRGGNISFSHDPKLKELHGGNTHLHTLSIFNEGKLLLNSILQVNKTGLTGQLKFTSDKNLIHPAYEVINVAGTGFRRIGYWSNNSGLSVVPPEMLYNKPSNSSSKQLYSVIWPGEPTQKPRGWVFPNNGRHLRIGVPNRVIYREFVSVDGPDSFTGYCIDVFTAAINLLPYAVPYKFYAFGDGKNNPETSELLQLITAGVYDAAVGDLAITTDGIRMVDFTQPFVQSGLVVVAPVRKLNSNAWAFLRPFTAKMWAVTGIFFLAVGVVVWILEHRINDDFRGPPKRQIVTILWFSFSTLFFAHKENARGTLGRLVLIIWLFVVLILNSSYTASLTSILTVEQLYSPIKGIKSLVSSHEPIGYQRGSFTESYLIEEYKIDKSRLVPLNSINDYAKALKDGPNKGGVAAVIDQRTYIELFLSSRCEFSIVGQEFSKIGWGFAFPRDSPLAFDMSTAILKLAEGGDLQRIHDKWLLRSACSLEGAKQDADRLQLKSFWGLYLLCGLACLLALLLHLIKMVRQFGKHYPGDLESTAQGSASVRFHTFLSFIDEKINETNRESKRRKLERGSNRSIPADESVPGSFKSNASDM